MGFSAALRAARGPFLVDGPGPARPRTPEGVIRAVGANDCPRYSPFGRAPTYFWRAPKVGKNALKPSGLRIPHFLISYATTFRLVVLSPVHLADAGAYFCAQFYRYCWLPRGTRHETCAAGLTPRGAGRRFCRLRGNGQLTYNLAYMLDLS